MDNSGGELVLRKPSLELSQAVFLLQSGAAGKGKALAAETTSMAEVAVAAMDAKDLEKRIMKDIEADSALEGGDRGGRKGERREGEGVCVWIYVCVYVYGPCFFSLLLRLLFALSSLCRLSLPSLLFPFSSLPAPFDPYPPTPRRLGLTACGARGGR